MLGPTPVGLDQRTAYEWRRKVQRQYEYAQSWARDLQAEAKEKVQRLKLKSGRSCQIDSRVDSRLEIPSGYSWDVFSPV
jgi:hypothetical protein